MELSEDLRAELARDGADPWEGAYFQALNAYRAARATGDPEKVAEAEDALRETVRAELTGCA